jgi:hypothetical protein
MPALEKNCHSTGKDFNSFVRKPRCTTFTIEEVEKVYYPEIEVLLKEVTGAEKVVVFDHQVRNIQLSKQGESNAREYVRTVHNDYTAKSGPRRVRDHLPAAEAEERLRHRFAEINAWRPIRGPIESTPLAICDAESIAPKDFVPTDLIYRDKVGEVYRFIYNPNHRWSYFPRLERNEVILLKCYDSKEDGRARFSAHSAFSMTQPARRTRRRARALKSAHWSSGRRINRPSRLRAAVFADVPAAAGKHGVFSPLSGDPLQVFVISVTVARTQGERGLPHNQSP